MRKMCLIIILAIIALSACDIFELRQPQPPTGEADWHDFVADPLLILENLRFAYEDARNTIHFRQIFAADYSFHFAPQDITDYNTDSFWNRDQELSALTNLHSLYDNMTVIFGEMETADEIGSNEACIYRSYELLDSGNTLAKGRLELQLRRISGFWRISRWYDYRISGFHSWGYLKNENS